MKYARIFPILCMAIILSLLMVVIPARPALAAPVISLSPISGAIGTTVTVTGVSFESYIGDSISILFNNVEIVNSPLTVPDTGSFTVDFDIPDDTAPGTASVTVRGPADSPLARTSFTIPETGIRLDAEEGTVGTEVTVIASGFYANKLIAFYYDYNGISLKLGTESAGPVGECRYEFVVPGSAAGKHKVTAQNAQGNLAEIDYEVIPAATLSPSSGGIGNTVDVIGTGFGSSCQITVYFRTATVAYADTDADGSFEGTFRVPAMKARTYDVKIEDEYGNTDWLEFTIAAVVSLNEITGNVGMEIVVDGSGFATGGTVTIKYDALEVTTAPVDSKGVFSATFDIPVGVSGRHVVTVSDGINTIQLAFTMESEAPLVPALLLPETGVEAESLAYFRWAGVDDPSLPITYSLQVASDEDFTSILLDKKGLTDSKYTLTEEEELESAEDGIHYYWRIKAIDSASNESEWSTPGWFYVPSASGFVLPPWVIYSLIGIAVVALVLVFLIFRLRRGANYY